MAKERKYSRSVSFPVYQVDALENISTKEITFSEHVRIAVEEYLLAKGILTDEVA